ncbi:MAG: DNA polymerase III subunit chi [Hydrogenophaga sp.]
MTEVAFHFNAPDRLGYACRLLRKAYLKGARVLVLADAPLAQALDQQLWTVGGTDFVPHALASAAPALLTHTPIVISDAPEPVPGQHQVLVNLRDTWPAGFEAFARVIEVITPEAPVREQARQRWRQYKAAGVEPQHLDIAQPAPAAP